MDGWGISVYICMWCMSVRADFCMEGAANHKKAGLKQAKPASKVESLKSDRIN